MYQHNRHSMIEVINKFIEYIEDTINNQVFVSYLDCYLVKENDPDWDEKLKYTLEYVINQKPTHLMNKEFYNNPYFLRYEKISEAWWIYPYMGRPGIREEVNKLKLAFLDHLKVKLVKR